jgi:hypothetical protein
MNQRTPLNDREQSHITMRGAAWHIRGSGTALECGDPRCSLRSLIASLRLHSTLPFLRVLAWR